MKHKLVARLLLISLPFLLSGNILAQIAVQSKKFSWQNPIKSGIDKGGLRDCQIIFDNGKWYMTGTSAPHWGDGTGNPGVVLYESDNLTNWIKIDTIVKNPGKAKWYYQRFWAPEIAKINGKYYCTFNCKNDYLNVPQSFGIAVADNITGPYNVLSEDNPVSAGNDANLFKDDDGKVYATWCGGANINRMTIAEIDLESGELKEEGTLIFEGTPGEWDAAGVEGACLFKLNGKYHMTYSSWTRGYEVGLATADNIKGPWIKSSINPFFGSQTKNKWADAVETDFSDIGHNHIFTGPDGELWLCCHGQLHDDDGPWLYITPIGMEKNGFPNHIIPSKKPQSILLPVHIPALHANTDNQWNGKYVGILGDSMSDPGMPVTTNRYYDYLADLIGIRTFPYAISGFQWKDLLGQAKKMKQEHSEDLDAILIWAGTNDFNASRPIGDFFTESWEVVNVNGKSEKRKKRTWVLDDTTFSGSLNTVLSYLKSNFPTQQIIILTPIHRSFARFGKNNVQPSEEYANAEGLYIDDYVRAIKRAGEIWSIPVIDLYSISGIYPLDKSHDCYIADPLTDRLHPNDEGHYRLARTLQTQLLSLPSTFKK